LRGYTEEDVRRALRRLRLADYDVLYRRYFEGQDIAVIAKMLERSVRAVYSLLHRARENLRWQLVEPAASPTHGRGEDGR
jgi:DNA-directed RNA polymerase specialized sigma24 family protein